VIVSHNVNAHTRLYSGENGYRAKVGVPKLMREGHEKTTWRTWSNK